MQRMDLKETIKEIEKDPQVIKWTNRLNKATKTNYILALAEFCQINQKKPLELLQIAYKEEQERTPAWEQHIEKWFEKYREHHHKMNRSKATASTRTTIVKHFFRLNKLKVPEDLLRRDENTLKIKNRRELITKEDIKTAIIAATNHKIKAVILCQCSSGLASADVLGLTIRQFYEGLIEVDKDKYVCRFHLERKKTGKEFHTFISHEAVEQVKKYLEYERPNIEMDAPLFTARRISNKALTVKGYISALNRMNKQLGWSNEEYEYAKFTSHVPRKFFSTKLTNAGMPEEIREHLMGHELRDKVKDAYYIGNPEDLLKVYLEYLDVLTIEETKIITIRTPEVRMLENKYDELAEDVGRISWVFEVLENNPQEYERLKKLKDK